jgi:hypothetical protein
MAASAGFGFGEKYGVSSCWEIRLLFCQLRLEHKV